MNYKLYEDETWAPDNPILEHFYDGISKLLTSGFFDNIIKFLKFNFWSNIIQKHDVQN